MELLGQQVDLKGNLLFSVRRYAFWWLFLLATVVFDYITTLHFIGELGVSAEGSAVVRWLINTLGTTGGVAVGKLLQLIAVAFFVALHRRLGNLFLLVVIVLNCWAIVVNTYA